MFRCNKEYRTEIREKMRNGDGSVKIEHFWEPGTEMKGNTRMVARLSLEPGCSIGYHEHINEEEIFIIIRGIAEAEDEGRKVVLHPGDTLLTGNGGHSLRNIGSETLEMIAMIAKF